MSSEATAGFYSTPNLRRRLRRPGEEEVDQQQDGADGDGGVSDVESGIGVGAEQQLEEIGDGAMDDAVGDVARGSAEEQREASGRKHAGLAAGDKQPAQHCNDSERAGDERDARAGASRLRENAERNACVLAVHK